MTEALVVLNGVTYTGDSAAQTITPADETSALALDILDTGEPIGPQTDEMAGVRGTWDHYPLSMIAAFMEIADADGGTITWYSDTGQPSPAGV